MKIKIRELALAIASFGPIGKLPFGAQIAALLAFPVHAILGWIYLLSATFLYFFVAALVLFMGLSVFLALRLETDEHPGVIVINNMLGMLVTFMCIPLTIKFAAIGFLLFYGVKQFVPLLARNLIGQSYESLPLFVTLLGVDIVAGFSVNIFLQFVLWMAN